VVSIVPIPIELFKRTVNGRRTDAGQGHRDERFVSITIMDYNQKWSSLVDMMMVNSRMETGIERSTNNRSDRKIKRRADI
jgi:hypothetical protein